MNIIDNYSHLRKWEIFITLIEFINEEEKGSAER